MNTQQSISIGIYHYPQAQKAATYGLMDLFATANNQRQLSEQPRPLLNALLIEQLEPVTELSALILPPSIEGTKHSKELAAMLLPLHQRGVLLCSVCAGAFLLAETGLLDNRKATTHWGLANEFQQRYPQVQLDTDKLLIDDGDIITAGGLMAWVDLGLKLVDRYLGPSVMLATARFLLVDPGGREQRFYSVFSPVLNHGDQAILQLQHWLQNHYAEAVTVSGMARMAKLTERTFIRRFQCATRLNPSEYLQHLRIGKARELMESSQLAVEQIAWQVGYQDPAAFRRTFRKIMGLTPKEYRYRFLARSQ